MRHLLPVALALLFSMACITPPPARVSAGPPPRVSPAQAEPLASTAVGPQEPQRLRSVRGLASYYGPGFHQRLAANGTRFNMYAMVAAHPTYPFGTVVRVHNLRNGRAVDVEIIDRGPARAPQADGVIIDLSQGAASRLEMIRDGRAPVRVDVLRWGRRS